jgi:plastocyanin
MRFRTSPLLLALLATIACGDSNEPNNDNVSPPADTDITIVRGASTAGPNAFSPGNLTISLASKTQVKWFNNDFTTGGGYGGGGGTSVTHRLVSNDGTTFTSSNIPGRGTFVANLSAPGAIAYHCTIHPGMTGTITVNP